MIHPKLALPFQIVDLLLSGLRWLWRLLRKFI